MQTSKGEPAVGTRVEFTHDYEIDAREGGGVVAKAGATGTVVGFDGLGGKPGREVLIKLDDADAFYGEYPEGLQKDLGYDAGVMSLDDLNGFHAETDEETGQEEPFSVFWSYVKAVAA